MIRNPNIDIQKYWQNIHMYKLKIVHQKIGILWLLIKQFSNSMTLLTCVSLLFSSNKGSNAEKALLRFHSRFN